MPSPAPPARLLWDQAGLWSLMTLETVREQGLAVSPITSAEVAAGGLEGARLLVVPGGWPALKKNALGDKGAAAIRRFVEDGGRYLGFCGGAGLALAVDDGLALVDLGRATGKGRLPSLSGPVRVTPGPATASHPIWSDLDDEAVLHVWWPGQFSREHDADIREVVLYQGRAPGLCTSDLELDQVSEDRWPDLEKAYGLRLKPERLWGQPAAIEADLGHGSLLLSYLHLDTPGDPAGGAALASLWRAWLGDEDALAHLPPPDRQPCPIAADMALKAQRLWHQGEDLGLWRPRLPVMPLWRRGARGLELWTLVRLCRAVAAAGCNGTESLIVPLAGRLDALWQQGQAVLEAQAAHLAGSKASPAAEAMDRAWFPQPRRMGDPLSGAIASLEQVLLKLERNERRED